MDNNKILHGNKAKADLKKKTDSDYITNSAIAAGKLEGKALIMNDILAEEGRKFEEQNKK